MTPPRLGCIADDYTGATDLSSMLVRRGLRVIQCFGVPNDPSIVADADVVVVALKSRSLPATDAVSISLEALAFLKRRGVQRFFFKYFDSLPLDGYQAQLFPFLQLSVNSFPVNTNFAGQVGLNDFQNDATVICGHFF